MWQYAYSTRTARVTLTYADTLTEGGRGVSGSNLDGYSDSGGRAVSGSTCTIHVPPQLL